jgi:hypothetical protein
MDFVVLIFLSFLLPGYLWLKLRTKSRFFYLLMPFRMHLEGVLLKSDRSADSHVRALRTHLKTSKTSAKWITRTQQSALRAFGQHALKLRPAIPR